jgi:hypothetical protein
MEAKENSSAEGLPPRQHDKKSEKIERVPNKLNSILSFLYHHKITEYMLY